MSYRYMHGFLRDVCNSDWSDKDFRKANLCYLDLSGKDLRKTDLRDADLRGTRLVSANLECANLSGANLEGANLEYANLTEARLSGAKRKNIEFIRGKILGTPIIAYKYVKKDMVVKVSLVGCLCTDLIKVSVPMIMKLKIPAGSVVFCINGGKCRTNKAEALELIRHDPSMANIVHPMFMQRFADKSMWGEEAFKVELIDYLEDEPAYSSYDYDFKYRLGKAKKVVDFDLQYNIECSTGIHFFMTKEEVMDYIRKYAIVM